MLQTQFFTGCNNGRKYQQVRDAKGPFIDGMLFSSMNGPFMPSYLYQVFHSFRPIFTASQLLLNEPTITGVDCQEGVNVMVDVPVAVRGISPRLSYTPALGPFSLIFNLRPSLSFALMVYLPAGIF